MSFFNLLISAVLSGIRACPPFFPQQDHDGGFTVLPGFIDGKIIAVEDHVLYPAGFFRHIGGVMFGGDA